MFFRFYPFIHKCLSFDSRLSLYRKIIMSLNEDCLLRFLLNPDELLINTEILKSYNSSMENDFVINNVSNKINTMVSKNKEV